MHGDIAWEKYYPSYCQYNNPENQGEEALKGQKDLTLKPFEHLLSWKIGHEFDIETSPTIKQNSPLANGIW